MKQAAVTLKYKGHQLHWTGWKSSPGQVVLVAQWFTVLPDGSFLYASHPGTLGIYPSVAFSINVGAQEGQEYLTQATETIRRQEIRAALLARLKDIIDLYDSGDLPIR